MARILITGATGFIGSYLTKYFIKKGYQIIAHGSSETTINNLKKILEIDNINLNKIEFWQQNFLDIDWSFPDFSKIDYVIHCAAASTIREGTYENYEKYFTTNVIATKLLAKKAYEVNIKHFIHLSSGMVFGITPSFPIIENTPKKPINVYGFTKLMGEIVLQSFGALGLKSTIIRPFSVYGKGHHNIVSIIKNKITNDEILTIYGDGTQLRAFTHVNDFCEAVGIILNNLQCFGEEYNFSGPKEYSVNDLVKLISNRLNKKVKIVRKDPIVDEITRNIADTTKIRDLGFSYKETLEEFIENEL